MEFEVKHKITSDLSGRIADMGFFLKKESHQVDHYFINNEQREDGRHYLRIREDRIHQTASLDYHVVITDLATKETEIKIDDPMGAKIILGYLGLKQICVVDKQRKSFSNGDVTLTLDTVKDLGEFIEIEIMGDDEESAQIEISKIESRLGLSEKERIRKQGYSDLLIRKTKGI